MHNCAVADYEYRAVMVPAGASREQTRDLLTIHAEYGDWELAHHAVWSDGRRKVTVRRRLRGEALPPMPT
ncbi:MAG: hypothetical protein QOE84_3352 [Actinomycetota bacterium]|nr:hypothetical protein [Actinomycetota bacterium]